MDHAVAGTPVARAALRGLFVLTIPPDPGPAPHRARGGRAYRPVVFDGGKFGTGTRLAGRDGQRLFYQLRRALPAKPHASMTNSHPKDHTWTDVIAGTAGDAKVTSTAQYKTVNRTHRCRPRLGKARGRANIPTTSAGRRPANGYR